ncbi:MAG: hypothetical protein WC009_07840 [Methylotenera sp.]
MPWFSWLGSPIIRALDEEQANIVLDALLSYPDLEDGVEYIAAYIAERWPAIVITFIGKRQEFARTDQVPPVSTEQLLKDFFAQIKRMENQL